MPIEDFVKKSWADYSKNQTYFERVQYWVYENRSSARNLEFGGMALGMMAQIPLASRRLDGRVVILSLAGALLFTIAYIAYKFLEGAVPVKHDMRNHAYKERSYKKGHLYYLNNIPILELKYEGQNPYYDAGFAQGYLTGAQTCDIIEKSKAILASVNKDDFQQIFSPILSKIPKDYQEEMKGFVAGYNLWRKKNRKQALTELDHQILCFISEPMKDAPQEEIDLSAENQPLRGGSEQTPPEESPLLNSTVIMTRESNGNTVVGCTMNWKGREFFGKYSIVVHRKFPDKSSKHTTVTIGIPGLMGDLTGWNDQGLFIDVNRRGSELEIAHKIPAIFFNRLCLESCKSGYDIEQKITLDPVLEDCDVCVVAPNESFTLHLNSAQTQLRNHERLTEHQPLFIIPSQGSASTIIQSLFMTQVAKQPINEAVVRKALELPHVTNLSSIHTFCYRARYPSSGASCSRGCEGKNRNSAGDGSSRGSLSIVILS